MATGPLPTARGEVVSAVLALYTAGLRDAKWRQRSYLIVLMAVSSFW